MNDEYISKDTLRQLIENIGMNYTYYSGSASSADTDFERYLRQYIEEKIEEGVRKAFMDLASDIIGAPSGGLCLLCKDATPSEDEQN